MKRFEIITEADARVLERGATVELPTGGHVTPLAQDTLRERRVTVVPEGSVDPAMPADLAPTADIRRVAIASDHTGVALRKAIVSAPARARRWRSTTSAPTDRRRSTIRTSRRRSPRLVARGEADAGIVIDGAGIGSAIAANKVAASAR